MKIGIITNLYPPYSRGGAENIVVRTVERLQELDHDVFVITGQPHWKRRGPKLGTASIERIYRFFPRNLYFVLDDFRIPKPIRLFWHIIDAISPYGATRVKKILKVESPDVVITHNLKGIGLAIPRAMQELGIPHIHIVHDLQLIFPSGLLYVGQEKVRWYEKPWISFYQAVCKYQFGKPDIVIFPSTYLTSFYREREFFMESRVLTLPNPAPRFAAIERDGRLDGPLRLLFVGQLEHHKGVDFLLDAIKDIKTDVQLIIAGEGTFSMRVKRLAEKDGRINYLGFVSLEQLINCFGIIDALVVPSLCYENSPTVIYEALNAGIPVLASDIGGVGELVEDKTNGILFHPGSKKDLLRAIEEMNAWKEEASEMQEEIQETVAPYAIEIYVDKLVQLIKSLKDVE
jgi:glycosyltransferase involved in cell wall biosynthesis